MKRHLEVLGLALLSSSIIGCNILGDDSKDTASANDTANLVKNYVPALFYSNTTQASEGLTNDARNTLGRTANAWGGYKSKFDSYMDWGVFFESVDANIASAQSHYSGITLYPADLTIAHDQLEAMRDTWAEMRAHNGTSDFSDKVTKAHHNMGPVAGASATYAASAKTQADLEALQTALGNTLPTYQADWSTLTTAYGDGSGVKAAYNLSTDKANSVTALVNGTGTLISGLSTATTDCTPATPNPACTNMVTLASQIKSKFVPFFLRFGDFINPFMSDIIANNKAMIPALYCTGNPPNAAQVCLAGTADPLSGTLAYLNALATAMSNVGAHFPGTSSGALGWGPSMMSADNKLQFAITKVKDAIAAGGTLADAKAAGAHNAIEAVRNAMHYVCATYENQVTLMTTNNDYHSAFEAILVVAVDPLTGAPKATLTANEVAQIDDLMAELQTAFAEMEAQTAIDIVAWGLAAGSLDSELAAQQANIDALVAALAAYDVTTNDNSGSIAALSMNLKKKYVPYFTALGTF
ncbi:MAG: hypothetical protein OEZ16_07995 [Chromatiales bacterium]|nr:hypothetical protein [Chromatiales bacterium]